MHNHVLLEPIEEHFRGCGATVHHEHPTRPGRSARFLDLHVRLNGRVIAVEAELSVKRVCADVEKAREVGAQLLLIVVPTRRVARTAVARLHEARVLSGDLAVWVLPLGRALQRLRDCFPLIPGANVPVEDRSQTAVGGRGGQ